MAGALVAALCGSTLFGCGDGQGQVDAAPDAAPPRECGRPAFLPRGVALSERLHSIAPIEGGSAAPIVDIFPRSGPTRAPVTYRLCVTDRDGVGNLDPARVSFELDGTDVSNHLCWNQVAEHTLCAEVDEVFGYQFASTARASVTDRDLARTDAETTYTQATTDPVRFINATAAAGLANDTFRGNTHTGGLAWIDYDRDGFPDLFVGGGAGSPNRLFHNNGDKTFTDVTPAIMEMTAQTVSGVIFADIDNDGDEDLYVFCDAEQFELYAPNEVPGDGGRLFRNDGPAGWTDITMQAGLADLSAAGQPFRTSTAAFADYDRDGCIDLFVAHWRLATPADPTWDPDRLYRGDCAGNFTDVTAAAGIDDKLRKGLAVLFADLNGDGWPDLYVANIFTDTFEEQVPQPDFHYGSESSYDLLFINNQDGTFTESSALALVGKDAGAPMAVVITDFDHDGDFDLYITDIREPVGYGNVLYRNLLAEEGSLRFVDEAFALGSRPLTHSFSWGANAADFNNDGHDDIFTVGNTDTWLSLNNGQGDFIAASSPPPYRGPGPGYTDETGITQDFNKHGSAVADYDGDGDLDIAVWVDRKTIELWENVSVNANHWLRVRLQATTSNGSAIGALVEVTTTDGYSHRRQVLGYDSAQSQSELTVHFGLGPRDSIATVTIHWPSGQTTTVSAPPVDAVLVVQEE